MKLKDLQNTWSSKR